MKNKLICRFTVTLAAVLYVTVFFATVYTGGADPDPEPLPETTEAPLSEEVEEPAIKGVEMESRNVPVTPKDDAVLVDDLFGDKQLITVTTKAGNYFYILVDQANEDREAAVHLLNQVDDADLQTLLGDGETEPGHCTYTIRYEAEIINTNYPVCKNSRNARIGPEPEIPKPKEAKPQEEKPNGVCGFVVFPAAVLAGGGAAFYYFKFRKPEEDVKDGDDLAEYDFGYDEDDEEEALGPGDVREPEEDRLTEKEAPEQSKGDGGRVFSQWLQRSQTWSVALWT